MLFLLVSCKSSSPIVTSKNEAKKRGTYTTRTTTASTTSHRNAKTPSSSRTAPVESSHRKHRKDEETNTDFADNNIVSRLISAAMKYKGVKYKGGGTTSAGMDCSGLVSTVFKSHDIMLPRTSRDMSTVGKKISKKEIRKGDLVFFKTNGRSVINHVGLVTEVNGDDILFIHASVQRGVIISSMSEPYYQRAFTQANRVIN